MLIQQSNIKLPLQIILKTVGMKNADIKMASDITTIFCIIRIRNFCTTKRLLTVCYIEQPKVTIWYTDV